MTMQCCLNIVETGNQPQAECNLFMSAMKELAAFFTAIDNLFGTEQARRSALNWIEELESIDWPNRGLYAELASSDGGSERSVKHFALHKGESVGKSAKRTHISA